MAEKLSETAREEAMSGLTDWSYDAAGAALTRKFKFSGFGEAFAFMTRVALLAEKAGHHPDWSNSYDTVTVTLSTHSEGGVTRKDIDLAQAIEKVLGGTK